MLDDGERENIKLIANALDRASTSCLTVGVATPIAGFVYNIVGFGSTLAWWRLALALIGWILAALALHFLARRVLRELSNVRN